MSQRRFTGTLTGKGGIKATCVVYAGGDMPDVLPDDEVEPSLPDGEYRLEVNGVPKRAIRKNGVWNGSDF